MSQNRAVNALVENHAQAGRSVWDPDHIPNLHPAFRHFFEHEAPKHIIAAPADEGDLQPEARRAAGKDGRGRADGEGSGLDQFFDLPKSRRDIARKDQVGVDFTSDENIKRRCHGF
jgi:hypothetical protein